MHFLLQHNIFNDCQIVEMNPFFNRAHIHIGQHIRCPTLFVVLPVWVVLTLLFISNTASLVAKVSLRLPGS